MSSKSKRLDLIKDFIKYDQIETIPIKKLAGKHHMTQQAVCASLRSPQRDEKIFLMLLELGYDPEEIPDWVNRPKRYRKRLTPPPKIKDTAPEPRKEEPPPESTQNFTLPQFTTSIQSISKEPLPVYILSVEDLRPSPFQEVIDEMRQDMIDDFINNIKNKPNEITCSFPITKAPLQDNTINLLLAYYFITQQNHSTQISYQDLVRMIVLNETNIAKDHQVRMNLWTQVLTCLKPKNRPKIKHTPKELPEPAPVNNPRKEKGIGEMLQEISEIQKRHRAEHFMRLGIEDPLKQAKRLSQQSFKDLFDPY
jgi:hypothetical protein